MEINLSIQRLRVFLGYKQDFVAKELNICQSRYSRKESGNREFTKEELLLLAKLFNVDLKYIERNSIPIIYTIGDSNTDKITNRSVKELLEFQRKLITELIENIK